MEENSANNSNIDNMNENLENEVAANESNGTHDDQLDLANEKMTWLDTLKTKWSRVILVLLLTIPYYSDILTDVLLAMRYFLQDDVWWGGLTTCFIVIPWLISIGLSLAVQQRGKTLWFYGYGCVEPHPEFQFLTLSSLLYVSPLFLKLDALRSKQPKGSDRRGREVKFMWSVLFLIEIIFESFLQLLLQLYIASRNNKLDPLLMFAIFTSALSMCVGLINTLFSKALHDMRYPRITTSLPREIVFTLLNLPIDLLTIASLFPPAASLSSMYPHANRYWVVVMAIYGFLHVLFISMVVEAIPIRHLNFRKLEIPNKMGY